MKKNKKTSFWKFNKAQKYIKQNLCRYCLSIFGVFAIIKLSLLVAGLFGIHSLSDVFAKDPLQLDRNNIESFCAIENKICDVHGMNISYIAPDTFTKHINLQELHLEDNQLTEFNVEGLSNLKILNLSYNNLTSIDLSGLKNLSELYIQENQLTELDVYGLSKIRTLDISYNYLSPEWIKKNYDFLNKNKVNYLPQNEPGQNNGDKEGNFSIKGALINNWTIYSGTLLGVNLLAQYKGENIGSAIIHVGVPLGFTPEDLDTNRGEPSTVYGGPGDACYTDFVQGTGLYVPHINTLVNNLIAKMIVCSGEPEIICTITLEENEEPTQLIHSEKINSSSGIAAWNRVILDVLTLKSQEQGQEQLLKTVASIKKMMEQQFAPSTILAQICVFLGEYNLNQCGALGELIEGGLGLESRESCGAKVYSSNKDIVIHSEDIHQNIFAGRHQYLSEGLDINLFVSSKETIDTDISDNMSRIHVNMKTGTGDNCINKSNTMETPYGDFATIYIINKEKCEEVMGVCIAGNMHQVDTEHITFIPIKDNEYYDNATCTIPSIPEAINLFITGNPIIGSTLTLGYTYIYDTIGTWETLGKSFSKESIRGFAVSSNGKAFVGQYDRNKKNSAIYTLKGNDWVPLGQTFRGDSIKGVIASPDGTVFLGQYDENNASTTIYTFDGKGWIPLGQPFIQGEIQDLIVSTGGTLFLNHNENNKIDNSNEIAELLQEAGELKIQSEKIEQEANVLKKKAYELEKEGLMDEAQQDRDQAETLQQEANSKKNEAQELINLAETLQQEENNTTNKNTIYTFDGKSWLPIGQSFTQGNISDLIVSHNGELFLQYYDYNNKTFVIYTLENDNWILVGQPFTEGEIRDVIVNHNGELFLTYNNYTDKSITIYTLIKNNWVAVGQPFTEGMVDGLSIDSDGSLFLLFNTRGIKDKKDKEHSGKSENEQKTNTFITNELEEKEKTKTNENTEAIVEKGETSQKELGGGIYIAKETTPRISTIYTFDGKSWLPFGQAFTQGIVAGFLISPDGEFYLGQYNENDDNMTIYTLREVTEGDSLYQWYRNDCPIIDEKAITYIIKTQDADTDISFSVIPVASDGKVGLLAKSKALHIPAIVQNPTSNGGGGGTSLLKDNCCTNSKLPGANIKCLDYSPSYYDGTCLSHTGNNYSNEITEAYIFAKDIGITTMSSIDNADIDGNLIRAHMAKMMVNYVSKTMQTPINTGKKCSFIDMKNKSKEMQEYTKIACQLGIMGIHPDGSPLTNFRPNDVISRAEFGTVLSRVLRGTENEGGIPYYTNHLKALKKSGIMTKINIPSANEVRGYVMLMFMRAAKK